MNQVPPLRIIFAGTPDFAATHLQALLDDIGSPHRVIAVYSQPDRPAGRGKKLQTSPVKALAVARDIQVLQPLNFKTIESQQEMAALEADLMIVVAYGLLLPQIILDTPKFGCINVHASLLPRWRGAAPIQRAIEAGDSETGVTIMQMDKGLDTGDMLLKARCNITPEDTAGTVHDNLAQIGVDALKETLTAIATAKLEPEIQDGTLSCYAAKISKQDAVIDWHLSAENIARKIRAFNPFPIAYSQLQGSRIKIWHAIVDDQQGTAGTIVRANKKEIVVACGEGSLSLQRLQLPGGKAMDVAALMNSKAQLFSSGTQFDLESEQQ